MANRRTVLLGVGAAGVSVATAACGNNGEPGAGSTDTGTPDSPGTGESTTEPIAKVSDVPVGGGVVLADQQVVLTQPEAGTIRGFSAVCTHRGCTVANVSDGTINCECHGSQFDVSDGEVRRGPATRPLPAKQVRVEGDDIFLGS